MAMFNVVDPGQEPRRNSALEFCTLVRHAFKALPLQAH